MVSGRLSTGTQGWLGGHQVHDTVVFPATGFIEVILRAGEWPAARSSTSWSCIPP